MSTSKSQESVPIDSNVQRDRWLVALILAGAAIISACSGTALTATSPTSTLADTAAIASPVEGRWRDEVAAVCDRFQSGVQAIPQPDGTLAGLAGYVNALRGLGRAAPAATAIVVPVAVHAAQNRFVDLAVAADSSLEAASSASVAGDAAGARAAVDRYVDDLVQARTAWALADVRSGDADPAGSRQLNSTWPWKGTRGSLPSDSARSG
jgi:hypothetical protein